MEQAKKTKEIAESITKMSGYKEMVELQKKLNADFAPIA